MRRGVILTGNFIQEFLNIGPSVCRPDLPCEQTQQLQNLYRPRYHFYKYTTGFPFHLQIGPEIDLDLLLSCVVVQIFDLTTLR